jgi:hypothetical protein
MAPQILQQSLAINSIPATTMGKIPDRENLKSMTRGEIQKLCKVDLDFSLTTGSRPNSALPSSPTTSRQTRKRMKW